MLTTTVTINIIPQASTGGNGGFGEDNRYLGAYMGRAGFLEAGAGLSFSTQEAYRDGLPPRGLGTESPVILELVANRFEAKIERLERDCPSGFITGHCEDGHRFAKELYCGREWCPVCNGKDDESMPMKPSHARRFGRWYPKAQQIGDMGYWTFTIPPGERWKYRSKEALTELGHDIQELLKKYGFKRGFKRWHFFGDKSEKYHPHLNCLVDGGKLPVKKLRKIRREYSRLLGVKLAIANYEYSDKPGKKVHWLRYVTRATFLDARWDVKLALELRGFHTTSLWGRQLWTGLAVWSLDDLPGEREADMSDSQARAVASLEKKKCPHDSLPIYWERFQPIKLLPYLDAEAIGAGYYELPGVSPPPYRFDFTAYERQVRWHRLVDTALILSGTPPRYSFVAKAAWASRHRRLVQEAALDENAWTEILTRQTTGADFAGTG